MVRIVPRRAHRERLAEAKRRDCGNKQPGSRAARQERYGAMVPDCTRNVVGDTGRCLMPLRHFSDAWVSQRANESPAGGGSHDPDQATDRAERKSVVSGKSV